MTVTSGDVQQMLTDRQVACPDCGLLMLGARIFDPKEQKAFIGLACRPCDKAYHYDV